jgi:hypothetical protein
MRIAFAATVLAALALVTPAPDVRAQPADDPGIAARQIQDGCVRRREDPRVCACGVGVAYAKLEPQVFALIPQIDPLIDERDRTRQITGLLAVASASRLTPQQVQAAYDTIRANRATVRAVCAPLGGR